MKNALTTAVLFAALLAITFLGESIAAFHLVGALLIFAGIFIASRPGLSR